MDLTNTIESPKGVYKKDNTIIKVEQYALDAFCVTSIEELASATQEFWRGVSAIGPEAFAELDFSKVTESSNERNNNGDSLVNNPIGKTYTSPTPSFYIPEDVREIGAGAFRGCKNVTSIQVGYRYYDKDKKQLIQSPPCRIDKEAFANIEGLTAVFIGSDKTVIDESAFAGNGFKNKFNHTSELNGEKHNDYMGYTSLSKEEIERRIQSALVNNTMTVTSIDPTLIKAIAKESDAPTM